MADATSAQSGRIYPNKLKFFLRAYWSIAIFTIILFIAGFAIASGGFQVDGSFALPLWAFGFIACAIALAHTFLHCNGTCIYFSGEEVVYETGILQKQTIRVTLHMITDTKLTRDLLDNLLGTAVIQINTSGSTGYEIEARFGSSQLEKFHNDLYGMIRKLPGSMPDEKAKKKQ